MPKVFIAADHGAFKEKARLVPFLESLGNEVVDCGAFALDVEDDYPDFVRPCAEKVAHTPGSFGIVLGGSGQGEAIAANRVPGVRAAVYYGEPARPQTDSDGAALGIVASARRHNDANVLSLGARFLSEGEAERVAEEFLYTAFEAEERHVRRIGKLG